MMVRRGNFGLVHLETSLISGEFHILFVFSPHDVPYSCGNGLLTHILCAEGYSGNGIDLRARTSWAHYPESSQAVLKVHALDPTQLLSPNTDATREETFLRSGVFIIGNHADELTPWIPVLATLAGASGYLSIPCCAWMFDERFTRSSTASSLDFFSDNELDPFAREDEDENEAAFIASLGLGAEGTHKSQYSAYRIWLARLSRWLGWKIECDTLRIPSTRNWAIVGAWFFAFFSKLRRLTLFRS
jgi:tRNASer (uridine44-2'-O)-methyltransferase